MKRMMYKLGKVGALRLVSFIPEDQPEQNSDHDRHEESDGVVLRVPPVGPMLFPEAGLALREERLGVLRREVKIAASRGWHA